MNRGIVSVFDDHSGMYYYYRAPRIPTVSAPPLSQPFVTFQDYDIEMPPGAQYYGRGHAPYGYILSPNQVQRTGCIPERDLIWAGFILLARWLFWRNS